MIGEERKISTIKDEVPLDAMERLVQIMTDSPTLLKLSKTEWKITALKPAVQWMIAQEACKIQKVEQATFSDVLMGLSEQIPSVCRIITLALLNDKKRINDAAEYQRVYDTLYWECDMSDWANLLFEILNLISVDCFFFTIELTQTFRLMTLERKTTTEERKQLSQEQATAKCSIS